MGSSHFPRSAQPFASARRWLSPQATNNNEIIQAVTTHARENGASDASLMFIDIDEHGQPEWLEVVANLAPENPTIGARYYLPEFPLTNLGISNPTTPVFIASIMTDPRVDEMTRSRLAENGKPCEFLAR